MRKIWDAFLRAKRWHRYSKKLRDHINHNGLMGRYNITKSLCQGHCLKGQVITIYPDAKTFTNVSMDDVEIIINEFLQ